MSVFCLHATYFATDGFAIKIGDVSSGVTEYGAEKMASLRLRALQIGNPRRIELIYATTNLSELEVHRQFKHLNISGEWFSPDMSLYKFISDHQGKSASPWPGLTSVEEHNALAQAISENEELVRRNEEVTANLEKVYRKGWDRAFESMLGGKELVERLVLDDLIQGDISLLYV